MISMIKSLTMGAIALGAIVCAHPGAHEEHGMSLAEKAEFHAQARRSLDECSHHLERHGILKRAAEKRLALYEKHKKPKAKRATPSQVSESHHSNLTGVTATSPDSTFFTTNTTCILNPEGEIGPFWVSGEYIREDLTENEPGVPLYLHAQFIDVSTCEPIPKLYWDVWNCNSTGVYSGVQSSMNGNGNDARNLNNTALRGIQATDSDGVAAFKTVFPGHYGGRATHIHIVAHLNATILPNNTLTGGSVPHIGQFFFDQDLITEVEALSPYTQNTAAKTLNANDRVVLAEATNSSSDPFFNYVLLGDTVSDGLVAWITVGVDTTKNYATSCGATFSAGGGKDCVSSFGGGPPKE